MQCAKLHLMFVSKEHEHSITAITSYKDFTITASGKQSLITIWHRGRRVHTFTGHTGRVDSLLMLGDHLLSTGRGAGRSLRLWNLSTMEPAGQLPPFDNDFSPSCLAHPATYLNKIVIGSEQGDIQLWNVQSKKLIYTFRTFADCRSSSSSSDNNGSSSSNNCHGGVTCMAQSPAVDVLGIGFADGTVCLHNMRADESIFSVKMTGGPVTAVTFRTDGRAVMATGGTRGAIAVWNLERRGELMALITAAHDAPVASLAFLEGEPVLVSAAEDNAVKMWIFDNNADPGAARLLRMRAGHSKPSTKIAYYGEGGRFLLSAAMDRSLRLFNIVRDQQMVEFSQGKGIAKKAKKIHKAAEQLKLPPIVDFAACKNSCLLCILLYIFVSFFFSLSWFF